MRSIKELGAEIKQRSTDTLESKHEGLECDTDREGSRGGEETGVMINLVVAYRMGRRGDRR